MIRKITALVLTVSLLLMIVPSAFAVVTLPNAGFSISVTTDPVVEGSTDTFYAYVKITDIPAADTAIKLLAFRFKYDKTKLIFQDPASVNELAGPMITNVAQDIISTFPDTSSPTPNFYFSYTCDTASRYLDAAKITADNTFVKMPFKLAEGATVEDALKITVTPTAEVGAASGVLVGKQDFIDYCAALNTSIDLRKPNKITAVTAPAAATIDGAIEWASATALLPTTVDVTANNPIFGAAPGSTTGTCPVTWSTTAPANYGKGAAGTYTVSGTVTAPDNTTFDTGVLSTVSLSLTVNAVKPTSVTGQKNATVAYGTSEASAIAKLTAKLTAALGAVKWTDVAATWTVADYDSEKAGKYTATATLARDGLDFSDIATITATITVSAKVDPSPDPLPTTPTGSTGSTRYIPIGGNNDDNVTIKLIVGEYAYTKNNTVYFMDAPSMYNDAGDRTLVPIRFVSEALGYTVSWSDTLQQVAISKGGTSIIMTIGSGTYTVNGIEKTMDTAPVLSSDRTYVPIRFVAEAFGMSVGWNESNQQVTFQK